MKFSVFAKKIGKEVDFPPLYVIVGPENFFRNKAITLIREHFSKEHFDPIIFYGHRKTRGEEKLTCAMVLDELRSLSLLSPRNLVIVRDGDHFLKDCKDDIIDYFKEPNLKSTLVLELDNLDQRLKVSKILKAKGVLIECKGLYDSVPHWIKSGVQESELSKWVRSHCQEEYRKSIETEAIRILCERVGNRLFDLDKELEKLSLYSNSERITRQDVMEVVADYKRSTYWDLSDALLEHNTSKALHCLNKMYQEGVLDQNGKVVHNPRDLAIVIVAILFNSFHQIVQVKEHMKFSQDLKKIMPNIKPTRLIKLQESARSIRNPSEKLEQLLAADLALKSSGANPEFILEKLMIDLSA